MRRRAVNITALSVIIGALVASALIHLRGDFASSDRADQSIARTEPQRQDRAGPFEPDFRDPALESTGARGEHPVVSLLRQARARYAAEWASLPQRVIETESSTLTNARRPVVEQLRDRLGLRPAGTFDGQLSGIVRRFQAAHGLAVTGQADPATIEALNAGAGPYLEKIDLNIRRAEALPGASGRSLLVDAGGATLSMYEGAKLVGRMPVIVGKGEMPTPVIYGLLRYAVFDPYWNVPPDIAQNKVVSGALKDGPAFLLVHRFEILSDWSDEARPLNPFTVDWKSARDSKTPLRVRQLPGPGNMMGAVKFMSPNPLGIYLHDTPDKHLFARADRHRSSGCVRLSDARRLARWLFNQDIPQGEGSDRRAELPQAVPVYITYFTVAVDQGRVTFLPDVYGRDPAAHIALRTADQSRSPLRSTSIDILAQPPRSRQARSHMVPA